MTKANAIRITAKNLDQALEQAAAQLGTSVDQLAYEVVSQTSGGILGFFSGGRRVEIAAWPKETHRGNGRSERRGASRREERAPRREESAPQADLPPLTATEVDTLVEDLRTFCSQMCERMIGEPVGVTAKVDGDRLVVNIDHEYLAESLGQNSKLAEAIEHVLRKKPRYLKRELPFRIFIDARGQRMARELELVEIAHDLSSKVHENKKPIVLNYKSSYDRKIIHMALDQDERVYTKSIGSGPNRKLMILPAKDRGSDHASADAHA